MKNPSSNVSQETLAKLGICVALVLAVAYFANVRSNMQITELKKQIVNSQVEIKKQKKLFPVYLRYAKELQKKVAEELPLKPVMNMSQEEVLAVTEKIKAIAVSSGLQVQSVVPDPGSLAASTGEVLVRCDFFGQFQDVRKFLVGVGDVEFLKHIEAIQLQEGHSGLVFKPVLRLAVQTD